MGEQNTGWFGEAFGGLTAISAPAAIITASIIAAAVIGLIYLKRHKNTNSAPPKTRWTVNELTAAALCIAASFLLSFIKIFSMPTGGSITPASMLPIMAFSYIYGFKRGAMAGLCYGFLQFIQEPVFLGPVQFLLDYPCAFTLLALAGLAKKNIIPGLIYGCAGRFACQFLSGFLFFGQYAPEGVPAWLYSLGYNGSICGVECAICVAVCAIPAVSSAFEKAKVKAVKHIAAQNASA